MHTYAVRGEVQKVYSRISVFLVGFSRVYIVDDVSRREVEVFLLLYRYRSSTVLL